MDPQLQRRDALASIELRNRLGADWLEFAERWSVNQRRVLMSDKQYIFAFGGNGAGKTSFGSYWVKQELEGYNPLTGQIVTRQHPVCGYCIAPTTEKVEGVSKPALRRWLAPGQLIREDRENDIWYFTEGRILKWKTGRQDPETFTGDEIDFCWIDEELATRKHWDEVLSRCFRRLGRVFNTLTPTEGTLWLHSWAFSPDEYPMEEKEIVRIDARENPYYHDCDLCSKPKLWHEPRIRGACERFDNTKGQLKLSLRMRQCKGRQNPVTKEWTGPTEFKIRIEGHYLLMAGRCVVDPNDLERLALLHRRDPHAGYLNSALKFVRMDDADDSRAWLRVQVGKGQGKDGKDRLFLLTPVRGRQYVIGVDAAEGNPNGDYHAAVVIDQESGEQCALAHTRSVPARDFGAFVCQLARFYNDAYVVIEANNHGTSIADTLIALGYGNLYKRMRLDAVAKKPMPRIGFWTDGKSKKPAVDMMGTFFADRMKIHDPIIYAEAHHYTWLKDARPGSNGVGNSNPDGHDDTMTALFCASVGLRQLGWAVVAPEDAPKVEYTKTISDHLMEDAQGRAMSEEEALEAAENSRGVTDVFEDDAENREWIP